MADYDEAEVTTREQKAADNQVDLMKSSAKNTKDQLANQLANYDYANRQNRRLADVQLIQNSRKNEADRFNQQRDLQSSAQGLLGSMNQALNGSATTNLMDMLESRNDRDNLSYWTTLQQNQNAVENAYDESVNQNNVAKNDAAINAEYALRALEGDLAANLNNINPTLYASPGEGDADLGGAGTYEANRVAENNARLSGYLMPENNAQMARQQDARNKVQNNSYFARLMNRKNGV